MVSPKKRKSGFFTFFDPARLARVPSFRSISENEKLVLTSALGPDVD